MSDQTKDHDANPPRRAPREDGETVEVERITEVTEHAGGATLVEEERVRAAPRPRNRNVAVIATVVIVAVFALVAMLAVAARRTPDRPSEGERGGGEGRRGRGHGEHGGAR